jgi:sugar/nucleoside kinase (ribokinase family)
VVDQTGAGDCFSAGFLSSYVEDPDPFTAAVYGNAVTSFVIERTGGASIARMPTKANAEARARELMAARAEG